MLNYENWKKKRQQEEALEEIAVSHICAECGGGLVTPWDPETNTIILRCSHDKTHQGYKKELSWTEKWKGGEAIPIDIANKLEKKERQKMEEQIGVEATKQLMPYYGVVSLTQEQATVILKTIWPKAPDVEVFKAALTCKSYGLNPLMKHLYLIPYEVQHTGKFIWSQVLGIGATRLIASRKPGGYSYKDGPRIMTEEEQVKIRGVFDPNTYWAITIIRDKNGNEAPGYGSWPKEKAVKGVEKGNTPQNMAMIRSERNAFDRLFPGEMPNLDVIDAQYIDAQYIDAGDASETPVPKIETKAPIPGSLPKTLQEFRQRCLWVGLRTERAICAELNLKSLSEITDFEGAWVAIQAVYGIKEQTIAAEAERMRINVEAEKAQEDLFGDKR